MAEASLPLGAVAVVVGTVVVVVVVVGVVVGIVVAVRIGAVERRCRLETFASNHSPPRGS